MKKQTGFHLAITIPTGPSICANRKRGSESERERERERALSSKQMHLISGTIVLADWPPLFAPSKMILIHLCSRRLNDGVNL